jgi:hypothetical protein
MDSASGVAAYSAAQRALSQSGSASAWERDYVRAVAARYAPVPPAARAGLDSTYAREMGAVAGKYPDDLDAQALYAEAMMDLRPWNYWTPQGKPYSGTEEIVRRLEQTIARNPGIPRLSLLHPRGGGGDTDRAVPRAERPARLMRGRAQGAMPAHTM